MLLAVRKAELLAQCDAHAEAAGFHRLVRLRLALVQLSLRRRRHQPSRYVVRNPNTRLNLPADEIPSGYVGATHFQEVAFVFDNVRGDGYAVNPFANASAAYLALAKTMSNAWINFVVGGDPNGGGLGLPGGATWPVYNTSVGGGVGQNIVFSDHGSFVEMDCWRAEAIDWLIKNSQAVLGI